MNLNLKLLTNLQSLEGFFDAVFPAENHKRAMLRAWKKDGSLHVDVDLPGVKKEDITVTVTKDTLLVEGKRSYQQSKFAEIEQSQETLSRRLRLSTEIIGEDINAVLENGVLHIVFPLIVPEERNIVVTEKITEKATTNNITKDTSALVQESWKNAEGKDTIK